MCSIHMPRWTTHPSNWQWKDDRKAHLIPQVGPSCKISSHFWAYPGRWQKLSCIHSYSQTLVILLNHWEFPSLLRVTEVLESQNKPSHPASKICVVHPTFSIGSTAKQHCMLSETGISQHGHHGSSWQLILTQTPAGQEWHVLPAAAPHLCLSAAAGHHAPPPPPSCASLCSVKTIHQLCWMSLIQTPQMIIL